MKIPEGARQEDRAFWMSAFLVVVVLHLWGLFLWAQTVNRLGFFVISWKWRLLFMALVIVAGIWAVGLWRIFRDAWAPQIPVSKPGWSTPIRLSSMLLTLISCAVPAVLIGGVITHPDVWQPFPVRLMLVGGCTLIGGILLEGIWPHGLAWQRVILAALLVGLGIVLLDYLPSISSYPFSLGWSEASRYYYASLLFAKRLYGKVVPLSPLHPSRYLVLSLPYVFGNLPLWAHRLWQVLLWLGMSMGTGLALAWRVRSSKLLPPMLMVLWSGLFLLQGPVYYHLLLCVIPLFLWFDPQRPMRSWVVVVGASIWAGLSRVNWFPMPAALAITLWLLEIPYSSSARLDRYFYWPFIYAVSGVTAALLAQAGYIAISGQPAWMFQSTFTSDLLWYRLFASPTYPIGILRGIVWVSVALWVLLGVNLVRHWRDISIWRIGGLLSILGVFFAGGLIVSVKIGGGSNIHNLDGYLVILMLIATYVLSNRMVLEANLQADFWRPLWMMSLVMLLPVGWHTYLARPISMPEDFDAAWRDVATIRQWAEATAQRGERVLFINQRHLLTFGEIQRVPLEPDYELLVLMEMAMSGNQQYLQGFYQALEEHRYGLIVTAPPNTPIQDPKRDAFAEENNAWVQNVVIPLLKHYRVALSLPSGVTLMVPNIMGDSGHSQSPLGWADWASVCGR